jgi:hypothetical protein
MVVPSLNCFTQTSKRSDCHGQSLGQVRTPRHEFVDVLEPLRDKGDAGFIFAVVSLPLLERYLREKSGAAIGDTALAIATR